MYLICNCTALRFCPLSLGNSPLPAHWFPVSEQTGLSAQTCPGLHWLKQGKGDPPRISVPGYLTASSPASMCLPIFAAHHHEASKPSQHHKRILRSPLSLTQSFPIASALPLLFPILHPGIGAFFFLLLSLLKTLLLSKKSTKLLEPEKKSNSLLWQRCPLVSKNGKTLSKNSKGSNR